MGNVSIDSPDDPRLEPYRDLKSTNKTRWAGRFVAEGEKLVRRLLDSDFRVHSVLVSRSYLASWTPPADVDALVVPDDWIERIVGFNFHRGVVACGYRKPSPALSQLCHAGRQRLTLVVCPDVQDPENLGTILRTSSALGVDGVVLGRDCCDPFSRRVLRVSMGAALRIPIVECQDLANELAEIRARSGVELWAAVTDSAATPFDGAHRPPRLALLVGSEGHGLSQQWIDLCDRQITIPMRPGTDSLNVAIATGILIQHLTRDRG
jgi:tRNA G18 (ribose-2'-O)-methylase SpoU